jgi:hypothetical protein
VDDNHDESGPNEKKPQWGGDAQPEYPQENHRRSEQDEEGDGDLNVHAFSG